MADLVQTASPLPSTVAEYDRVTIAPAPAMRRYSLRARNRDVLSGVIGRPLPDRIGRELDGIAQLGPDEFLALLPEAAELPFGVGQAVSIVEVSSRAVGIVVEGPRAAETIMAGCPLDLTQFAPGRTVRTVFETVEIVVRCQSAERFHIEVWRSFAPWLWLALTEAAA